MPKTQPGCWRTDAEAFAAGALMIRALRASRGLDPGTTPNSAEAERIVSAFCRSLRRSPRYLILSRLQRQYRLTAEGMVLVVYTLCATAGVPGVPNDASQMLLAAAGFNPPALGRAMELTGHGHVQRLLSIEQGRAYVTPELFHIAYMPHLGCSPIESLRADIAALPTAPAARDDWKARRTRQA